METVSLKANQGWAKSSAFRRLPGSCNTSPNAMAFLEHYFIPCEVGVHVSILEKKKLKLQEGKGLACGRVAGK